MYMYTYSTLSMTPSIYSCMPSTTIHNGLPVSPSWSPQSQSWPLTTSAFGKIPFADIVFEPNLRDTRDLDKWKRSIGRTRVSSTGGGSLGGGKLLPQNDLASHPKRSTISLHHTQEHYMTETLLLKNKSIELQICTVHKQVWYFISKNQPGLRRSDPLRQAKLCWLATL